MIYLVLFAYTNQLELIFAASLFRGIAEVIIMAASYAFASVLIPPQRRGFLFGLFNATLFLSWGIGGTLIAGPIVDGLIHAGISEVLAYRAAYLSGLVLVVIGLVIHSVLIFSLIPKAGIPVLRCTDNL
jgi:MFS family permease